MKTVICGLDVASTSAAACVQKADGSIHHALTLPATREGADRLLALLLPDSAVFMESTGRYHLSWARRLATALYGILRQPLSAAAVFDALLPALQAQLRLIESLRDQQLTLLASIRAAVITAQRSDDVALAESIPGYGEKTAATLVACVPEDFRSWGPKQKVMRKLQALFGCDPKLRESGKWKGQVRMSKRGIELARTALFQAATCAMLHDPTMKAVFDRKQAEGKFYLVCVSHVMRIQLRRLVAVLYDRKPFVLHPSQPPLPA